VTQTKKGYLLSLIWSGLDNQAVTRTPRCTEGSK